MECQLEKTNFIEVDVKDVMFNISEKMKTEVDTTIGVLKKRFHHSKSRLLSIKLADMDKKNQVYLSRYRFFLKRDYLPINKPASFFGFEDGATTKTLSNDTTFSSLGICDSDMKIEIFVEISETTVIDKVTRILIIAGATSVFGKLFINSLLKAGYHVFILKENDNECDSFKNMDRVTLLDSIYYDPHKYTFSENSTVIYPADNLYFDVSINLSSETNEVKMKQSGDMTFYGIMGITCQCCFKYLPLDLSDLEKEDMSYLIKRIKFWFKEEDYKGISNFHYTLEKANLHLLLKDLEDVLVLPVLGSLIESQNDQTIQQVLSQLMDFVAKPWNYKKGLLPLDLQSNTHYYTHKQLMEKCCDSGAENFSKDMMNVKRVHMDSDFHGLVHKKGKDGNIFHKESRLGHYGKPKRKDLNELDISTSFCPQCRENSCGPIKLIDRKCWKCSSCAYCKMKYSGWMDMSAHSCSEKYKY